MKKPEYHVASFSGGKDSTATVLRMIDRGDRLDEVLCCDTTMEFPAMYRHIEKVKKVVEAAGIKFTMLKAEHDFEYYLAEHKAHNRKQTSEHYGVPGYGWPNSNIRWCTRHLKIEVIGRYLKKLQETHEITQYLGIAADEDYRLKKKNNQASNFRYPLREWGWDEEKALQYCYSQGYDWEGLYEIKRNEKTGRSRVSCWCCPLQSYDELRNLRTHFPDLWGRLLELDRKQWKPYNHGYSVSDFDLRFSLEYALTISGHSIKDKAFFADYKRLLAGEVTIKKIIQEREATP